MTLSKYSKRHVQFEALEAKKLFAADLVGGAVADLPDTAVVAEIAPVGGYVDDLVSVQMNPGDAVVELSDPSSPVNSLKSKTSEARTNFNSREYTVDDACDFTISPNYVVGGQEGEPVTGIIDDGLADSPSLTNVSAESDDTVRAFLVAALDPGDAVSGVHGDVTNSLKVKDFTVEQNLVQNFTVQEGADISHQVKQDTPHCVVEKDNFTKCGPWAQHNIIVTGIIDDGLADSPGLGGQEGEPVTGTIDDGLADTPNFEQDTDQTLHPAENLSSAQSRVRDEDLTNDSPTQVHHIKPHGSAGSWSDYPEFTELHQLGGQEGEPVFDADDWDWIDNQSVQESLHACDANGQGATRHNVTGFTEVDHVFEQYAAEIGAHNTQWDLLCSK